MSKKKRPPLEKLERAWIKASPEERRLFLLFLANSDTAATGGKSAGPIASGRYLTADAIALTREMLRRHDLTLLELAAELGLEGDELPRALTRGYPLRLAAVRGLEHWLEARRREPES